MTPTDTESEAPAADAADTAGEEGESKRELSQTKDSGDDEPKNKKQEMSSFLTSLENKAGDAVDESSLKGKIVALYFSSSWCGACKSLTPLLSVLYEDAHEEDCGFEVIYVSSDNTETDCKQYMDEKHANWLRIPYDSPERQALKQKYGVFAGKEQSDFPSTKRRSGIPTLVVVGRNGEEHALLDCDDSKVVRDIESQGCAFLDQWGTYKW